MSDDRYAPPSAPLVEPLSERAGGRIDLGEAFSQAWSATWANFGVLLLASVVGIAVGLLAAFTVVGIVFVLPVLSYGGFRFTLNVLDGRGEVADLFSGFSDYGRVLGQMLVLTLLIVAIGLAGQSIDLLGRATHSGLLLALGGVVNLVWQFFVMMRVNFATYYVVDRGMAPVDALRTAWARTADQKLTCAVMGLLFALILLVGFAALVIGLIPAMMVAVLLQAAAYRQLAGRSAAA